MQWRLIRKLFYCHQVENDPGLVVSPRLATKQTYEYLEAVTSELKAQAVRTRRSHEINVRKVLTIYLTYYLLTRPNS